MPRNYSPLRKANVLQILDQNEGDVALTSQQTGIPVRTLYSWRREREQQALLQSLQLRQESQMPQNPPPEFDDDAGAYGFLRQQVLREVTHIAANFNLGAATPSQRLAALNQLFEYLSEVDKRLQWTQRYIPPPPESPEEVMQTYIRYYRKHGKWIGPGSPPADLESPAEEETYDPALSLTIRPAAS